MDRVYHVNVSAREKQWEEDVEGWNRMGGKGGGWRSGAKMTVSIFDLRVGTGDSCSLLGHNYGLNTMICGKGKSTQLG